VARPPDVGKLLAGAQTRLDRGSGKRTGKAIDHLLAAAKQRGSQRKIDAATVEATFAAARAQLRAGRTRD
jgi:hypothetical protein